MRKFLFLILLAPACLFVSAQGENPDTLRNYRKKIYYTYMGVQVNLLLQQFISFNSNSSINSNPYLFTFVKSNMKTGSGFSFGTGFNISENSSNDGVSSLDVENVNISFRFGYEKKYLQLQKFVPFWGLDMGMGVLYNKTSSQLNQAFNNGNTVTESTKYFFGPAFRAGLLYSCTKHIFLGTEFFFNSQISTTSSSVSGGNGSNSVSSLTNFVPFNVGFQAPTALFLIYRY